MERNIDVHTSVDDLRSSLRLVKDKSVLPNLKHALAYEVMHRNRATVIKLLKNKIRQLNKILQ